MAMQALPAPLHWRPARAQDAAFLEALFQAGHPELLAAGGPQLARMQRQVQEAGLRQAYPAALRQVIEREGEAIGLAVVDLGPHELRLLDLAVAPAARRQGVAREVLGQLQREAAARGVPLGLTVAAANTPARKLYDALGFRVVEDRMVVLQLAWRPQAQA